MTNPKILLVNTPVANLRKEPVAHKGAYVEDPLQETQLLLGEPLLGKESKEEWTYVHAPNQPFFSKTGEWTGYPGWVSNDAIIETTFTLDDSLIVTEHAAPLETEKGTLYLSIGTVLDLAEETGNQYTVFLPDESHATINKKYCRLKGESISNRGQYIIERAKTFFNMPYLWGGCSSYMPDHHPLTSIDCSGLIYLLHTLIGETIPRNAHDQYLRALRLDLEDLEPGDLVFLAKPDNPERIMHVMIFENTDQLIEASSEANKVQTNSPQEKIGCRLERVKPEGQAPNYFVYFGSFVKDSVLDKNFLPRS